MEVLEISHFVSIFDHFISCILNRFELIPDEAVAIIIHQDM